MCGIAGEISLGACANLNRSKPMIDTILHRGPDGLGYWSDPHNQVALLHCRLAIVDIAGGHQPMHSTSDEIVIVFNGEIYGYKKWRTDLKNSGYRFRSESDTEVLIALYLRDGPSFVDKLEGEFAFVLYDGKQRRTLIARDRFGIKPLFYCITNGLILFGSEIKAIFAHPFAERRFDPEVLNRRIHGVLLPDETIFAGIKTVPPGHAITIDRTGHIICRRHAGLDPELAGSSRIDRSSAEDAFDEAFSEAVTDRLQGDADIGVYLSGGVDSSLVACVMGQNSTSSHRAYTIGFDCPPYGEAGDAARTAGQLGLQHEIEPIGTGDLDDHFVRSLWHCETTVVNAHGTAKMRLSERASRRVKVVLVGEGADELHGGYAYFRHASLIEASGGNGASNQLQQFLKANGLEDGVLASATYRRRSKLANGSSAAIPYSALRASVIQDVFGRCVSSDFRSQVQPDPAVQLLEWIDHHDPAARKKLNDMALSRYASAITDMPNYHLGFLGDRSEMANGIEGRLPYLDRRVVDLLWSLPDEFHLGDQTKTLIRSSLARRLNGNAANRYKRLFVAPWVATKGMFEGALARRWLSAEATASAGVFHPAWVSGVLRAYNFLPPRSRFRKALEGFLMTVLSVNILDDLFVKNFAASLERFKPAEAAVAQLVATPESK
ncbi:MAG: asparagine synthase (glutamine-hydrolyzing) [Alphaproteobacteria bacterium]|nr:asparagine synthase (glutamine-hydrolyzing) [Alphaproteobacteria bacterium]